MLMSGSECEYHAEDGSWHPAVVSVCRLGEGASASGSASFDVTFFKEGQMDVAEGVPRSQLRTAAYAISAPAPASSGVKDEMGKPQHEEEQGADLDTETVTDTQTETGLGAWQTVSTRMVDELEGANRKRKLEAELRIRTNSHSRPVPRGHRLEQEQSAGGEAEAEAALGSREARSGGGGAVYKGVDMAAPSTADTNGERASIAAGVKVAFKNKKRRLMHMHTPTTASADSSIPAAPAASAMTVKVNMEVGVACHGETVCARPQCQAGEGELVSVTPETFAARAPAPAPESAQPVVVKMKTKKRAFRAVAAALGEDSD